MSIGKESYSPLKLQVEPNQALQEHVHRKREESLKPHHEIHEDLMEGIHEEHPFRKPPQAVQLKGGNQESPYAHQALSHRASHFYNNAIHDLVNRSKYESHLHSLQRQRTAIQDASDEYQIYQGRLNLHYQQVSFQREAAIMEETNRRQLLSGLFQGAGAIGGAFAAKGIYNARHQTPFESPGLGSPAGGQFVYQDSGALAPSGYNSRYFGRLGNG